MNKLSLPCLRAGKHRSNTETQGLFMASVSGPILWLSEPNMGVGTFKKEVAGLSSKFVLIVLIATSWRERDF